MADEWDSFPDAGRQKDEWDAFPDALAPKASEPLGWGDTATDVARSGGIGLAKGAIGLAGLPGDLRGLASSATDYAGEKLGLDPEKTQRFKDTAYNMTQATPGFGIFAGPKSHEIQEAVEGHTGKFYKPKTTAGEYAQTTGEFAPGMIGGPGSLATKALTRVAAPAIASETAGQLTKGTEAEPYVRIGSAVLGGAGANIISGLPAAAVKAASKKAIPTVEELKTAARAQYKHPDVAAVQIKPDAVENLAGSIRTELESRGFREWNHSGPFKAIDELTNPMTAAATKAGSPVTVQDIDAVQTVLRNISAERNNLGKLTPDAVAASIANKKIGDFLSGLKQPNLIAGDAKKAAAILADARANWGAASRAESIQTLQENARIQAGSTYSGGNQNNATRQALRPLLRNDASKAYGYNAEELAQLDRAVMGTNTGNSARWVGKQLGNVANVASVLAAGATMNPALLTTIPGGMIARAVGNASARRQGNILDQKLRSRSPLNEQRQKGFPLTKSQQSIYEQAMRNALLSSNQARGLPLGYKPPQPSE